MSHRHRCPSCGTAVVCNMPTRVPAGEPSCEVTSELPAFAYGCDLLCEPCARRKVAEGRRGPKGVVS